MGRAKAVFLDRDGVINVKLPPDAYVSRIEEFEVLPGAANALRSLREMGYLLIVVTNQRGIARGFMTVEDLTRVHEYMRFLLGESGAAPDAVYFCPHEKHTGCGCRKPDPGMLLAAMRDLDVDPHVSFMVGDSPSDIQAGAQAGVRTVRISDAHDPDADFTFGSLDAFACALAREIRAGSEPFPRTKGR